MLLQALVGALATAAITMLALAPMPADRQIGRRRRRR